MAKVLIFLHIIATYFVWLYYEWGKDLFKTVYHWLCIVLPVDETVVAGGIVGLAFGIVVTGFAFCVGKDGWLLGTILMCVGFLLLSGVLQAGKCVLGPGCHAAFMSCFAVVGTLHFIATRLPSSEGDNHSGAHEGDDHLNEKEPE